MKPEVNQTRMESPHFHDKTKGCEIENKTIEVTHRDVVTLLKEQYCKTHQKDICKCGWEWGYHFGIKNDEKLWQDK